MFGLRSKSRRRTAVGIVLVAIGALGAGMLALPALAEEATVSIPAEGWSGRPAPAPGQIPDNDLTGGIDDNAPSAEIQPNTLPAGLRNGQPSHQSYLAFAFPDIGDGTVTSMRLTLTEEGSAANTPTGVIACLVLAEWPAEAGFGWGDQPDNDPDACSALIDQEDGTWIADLKFQASLWLERGTANHGVVLVPGGPENLPVGQPNPETLNYLISFGGTSATAPPVITFTFDPAAAPVPDEPPPAPDPFVPPAQDTRSQPPPSTTSSGGSFFSAPTFTPPATVVPEAAAPEVAPPAGDPVPEPVAVGAPAVRTEPSTPAYVWLLIPIGLAGVLVLSQSLTSEAALAVERDGATTRLLQRRRGEVIGETAAPAFQV